MSVCVVCGCNLKNKKYTDRSEIMNQHIESAHPEFVAVSNQLRDVYLTSKNTNEMQVRMDSIFKENGVDLNLTIITNSNERSRSDLSNTRTFIKYFDIDIDDELITNSIPFTEIQVSGNYLITDNTKVLGKMLEYYYKSKRSEFFDNVIGYSQSKHLYWSDTYYNVFYAMHYTKNTSMTDFVYGSCIPNILLPGFNILKIDGPTIKADIQSSFDDLCNKLLNDYRYEINHYVSVDSNLLDLGRQISEVQSKLDNMKKAYENIRKITITKRTLECKYNLPEVTNELLDLTKYNHVRKEMHDNTSNRHIEAELKYVTDDLSKINTLTKKADKIIQTYPEIFL